MGLIRIAGYPMDLAMTESFHFPGEVTKYPVEEGADISDHIRDMPPEIELECIVSDSPSGAIATDPSRQISAGPDGNTPLPSTDALAKLREIKAARQPVSIETSIGVFAMMAFLDLQVEINASRSPGHTDSDPTKARSGGLFFTAKFERINVVTNKRTKIRVKTAMAGGGGAAKPKAVVGKAIRIDDTIVWRHGVPSGAPFRPGNPVEIISVSYKKVPGLTRDEVLAVARAGPGSDVVVYLDADGHQLSDQRHNDLVADLERDANAKRQKPFGPQLDAAGQLRRDQNLPPGVDLSRWDRPAPDPTFAPSAKDLDFSRFTTPRAPTFP